MTYDGLLIMLCVTWAVIIIAVTLGLAYYLDKRYYRKRYNLELELETLMRSTKDPWEKRVLRDSLEFISRVIDWYHHKKDSEGEDSDTDNENM